MNAHKFDAIHTNTHVRWPTEPFFFAIFYRPRNKQLKINKGKMNLSTLLDFVFIIIGL